ncbi:hypothetical protein Moror_1191 [Moniliophthora roreri MCA 2997]|uniref:Uncharacterized protein n=2 Tax=Moniliophthora roreri TaxID=221103 RepID=V2WSZ8_MONRO|nr:hypothetical protein Moror_1191 [Moniliophthora roreri MCA 2997]
MLTVTNVGARSAEPSTSAALGSEALVMHTLATSVDSQSEAYTWPKVNVPQGWYTIIATYTDPNYSPTLSARTRSFMVQNGTDVSCIGIVMLSSGISSGSIPETLRSSEQTTINPTASGTSEKNISKSQTKRSVIIGASIGSLLVVAIASGLFAVCRRRSRRLVSGSEDNAVSIDPYPIAKIDKVRRRHRRRKDVQSSLETLEPIPDEELEEAHVDSPHGLPPIFEEKSIRHNHLVACGSSPSPPPARQPRVRRHEDSGWRPRAPPPPSDSGSSNLIDMPPEYESAL